MKVLISAYACEPGKGSEPAVGWNFARSLAGLHEVWVITRRNNRESIVGEMAAHPVPCLHFIYYDLPRWASWWKHKQHGVQIYYYLWQLCIYPIVKKLHWQIGFDVAHHVTFVNYYRPSLIWKLGIPFVWGPVGGGESAPLAFWRSFGLPGICYEAVRCLARWLGEHDPWVRLTAKCADLALATTPETAERLRRLGCRNVEVFNQVGLLSEEIQQLSSLPIPPTSPFRFVSVGRLIHWKGFHLGLEAFARAAIENSEYWIIGDGPEYKRLEELAHSLGIANQVKFFGMLPRNKTLETLGSCHVLVHPSLHESGGWVVAEAMAMGKPVICLDLGGPKHITSLSCGVVPSVTQQSTIEIMADNMKSLYLQRNDIGLQKEELLRNVYAKCDWENKAQNISEQYSLLKKIK